MLHLMLYNHEVYGWTEKKKSPRMGSNLNVVFMVAIEGGLMGLLA